MSETIAAQVKDDDEGGEEEEMKEDEDDEGVGKVPGSQRQIKPVEGMIANDHESNRGEDPRAGSYRCEAKATSDNAPRY